jgi:hypothetical protein
MSQNQQIMGDVGNVRIPPSPPNTARPYRRDSTIRNGLTAGRKPEQSLLSPLSIVSRDMSRDMGVRKVPLSRGLFALVDEADYPRVIQHKWYARLENRTIYALRDLPRLPGQKYRAKEKLHRFLLGAAGAELVDHWDGDGLNNTRANLRRATVAENNRNIRKPAHGLTSQYKGVSWHPKAQKYQASIRFQKRNYYLGLFLDPVDAAWAYDREARRLHGAFAACNFAPPPILWRPR